MVKSDPLVSIIMPAYNCEKYIEQAIQSILNQTYSNWEFLITDDASTDNTLAIIKQFAIGEPRMIVFSNSENLKLLKTRNRLLDIVSGDLITFQDADDYADPQRLELMVKEFKHNPKLGILASQVAYVDEADKILRISNKPLHYNEVLEKIYDHNVVGGSIMMIRRSALQFVGGKFREYFDGLSYQDYDLSLLIAEKFEAYSLPQILYYYRQHDKSSSKIVNVDRLVTKEVVSHLAKQRRERGKDDLMDAKPELVNAYFDKLRKPYRDDLSLVYRDYTANYMYNNLFKKAIKTAWQAILISPFNFLNWRTLQYCLRISIFKLLSKGAN